MSGSSNSKSAVVLVICTAGIYASFLTWGYLQEQISSQKFGPGDEVFHAPFFINLIQNLFGFLVGYFYLFYKNISVASEERVSIFQFQFLKSLTIVALTQSLSSPIGLSSIEHVDYLLYTLAKSCKLIPVMVVHIVLYKRKFPLYKYLVAGIVTCGVLLFTLGNPSKKSGDSSSNYGNVPLGLFYLSCSLILDGLTNSTQDILFKNNKKLTGAHLMCGLNFVSFWLTLGYAGLLSNQLHYAIYFIKVYPLILKEILMYALFGAIGQIFIFVTLEKFGSLILVTVTVTRKMMSMLLSVFLFGHDLGAYQWAGLLFVFGGIGFEAFLKFQQKPADATSKVKKN